MTDKDLLERAHELFTSAMENAGRLDAAGAISQWLDDYAALSGDGDAPQTDDQPTVDGGPGASPEQPQ